MNEIPSQRPPRRTILDSPWYWVYVFCAAALVALVLVGPKFAERQSQIERQGQGRDRAARQRVGQEPATPMSTPEATAISLRPLALVLAAVFAASWCILWWRHFRRSSAAEASAPNQNSSSSGFSESLRSQANP